MFRSGNVCFFQASFVEWPEGRGKYALPFSFVDLLITYFARFRQLV